MRNVSNFCSIPSAAEKYETGKQSHLNSLQRI